MASDIAGILLADDHTLYREGLRELIGHWDDFEVVGEAANGREAVEVYAHCTPDVILMDVQMPVMDGVEATRLIHTQSPQVAIVMLTMSIEDESLFEAIRWGARGYILKDISARHLHDRLREVLKGEGVLSGAVAARVLEEFTRLQEHEPPQGAAQPVAVKLTESEAQILRLVAQGLSNDEIGDRLFLSEGAVKKKLSVILRKLHLNNRVQAATYAVRAGLAD
jgi:DNA-binding NarL/FixJ family response regulator